MSHVFISYVRENRDEVQRLTDELTRHGVKVWLDKNEIKPGYRWEDAILEAIENGDFFIACFSKEYSAKNESYMNEEITLAIERLRRIPHDRAWFIPVLFSGRVPNWRIGAGDTLRSIQWTELSDMNWGDGVRRILDVIQPIPVEVQRLIEALSSTDINLRIMAAKELGGIGHARAVPVLIATLDDKDKRVVAASIQSLGWVGGSQAAAGLTGVLAIGGAIAAAAVKALSRIGKNARPVVEGALANSNEWLIRFHAAEALGRIGVSAGVPALIKALEDSDERVRRNAAKALNEIGTPEALKAVEEYEKWNK